MLLQYSSSHGNNTSSISGAVYQNQIETPGEIFNWLAILWERGFNHDNPQGNSEVNVIVFYHLVFIMFMEIFTLNNFSYLFIEQFHPQITPFLCIMQLGA